MTAIAERKMTAEPACYEVRCPETGEVLAYMMVSRGGVPQYLGEALEQNGLRLVASTPELGVSDLGRLIA